MLVDAFVVYKCVSSLLRVSVLPLLELDFKRVYFIQTDTRRTRLECFDTTSGRRRCCFQVPRCFSRRRPVKSWCKRKERKKILHECTAIKSPNVQRSCVNRRERRFKRLYLHGRPVCRRGSMEHSVSSVGKPKKNKEHTGIFYNQTGGVSRRRYCS